MLPVWPWNGLPSSYTFFLLRMAVSQTPKNRKQIRFWVLVFFWEVRLTIQIMGPNFRWYKFSTTKQSLEQNMCLNGLWTTRVFSNSFCLCSEKAVWFIIQKKTATENAVANPFTGNALHCNGLCRTNHPLLASASMNSSRSHHPETNLTSNKWSPLKITKKNHHHSWCLSRLTGPGFMKI